MGTKTPTSRPKMKRENVEKEIKRFALNNLDGYPVKVLGIRGYYAKTMGETPQNERGIYDDGIFIIAPNYFGAFNGNTDPSIQRPGIAKLVAPQLIYYKPGIHGISGSNPRPAFRQYSRVTVQRDGKAGTFTDTAQSPFFTNLHDGGNFTTSSEGCQTIIKSQWEEFRNKLNQLLKENNQEIFPYVLIEYK